MYQEDKALDEKSQQTLLSNEQKTTDHQQESPAFNLNALALYAVQRLEIENPKDTLEQNNPSVEDTGLSTTDVILNAENAQEKKSRTVDDLASDAGFAIIYLINAILKGNNKYIKMLPGNKGAEFSTQNIKITIDYESKQMKIRAVNQEDHDIVKNNNQDFSEKMAPFQKLFYYSQKRLSENQEKSPKTVDDLVLDAGLAIAGFIYALFKQSKDKVLVNLPNNQGLMFSTDKIVLILQYRKRNLEVRISPEDCNLILGPNKEYFEGKVAPYITILNYALNKKIKEKFRPKSAQEESGSKRKQEQEPEEPQIDKKNRPLIEASGGSNAIQESTRQEVLDGTNKVYLTRSTEKSLHNPESAANKQSDIKLKKPHSEQKRKH